MDLKLISLTLLLLLSHRTKVVLTDIYEDLYEKRCQCVDFIVDCRSQSLSEFPAQIPENTEAVYLDGNKLTALTQLSEKAALKTLSLSNNKISELKYDTFDYLDALTTLSLSNNSISFIADDIFEWNPLKLQVLRLDGNYIEFVQHFLFYDLVDLTTLHLQNNEITFIHPHAFLQLKNLRDLRLDGNRLMTFDPKWIQKLAANDIRQVRFDNNPWSCDCAMNNAIYWLKRSAKARWFTDLTIDHRIRCKTPAMYVSWMVQDLTVREVTATCDIPSITGISAKASLATGRDVLLRCIVDQTKFPRPSISWTAPNGDVHRLETAGNFEGVVVHQDGSLMIKNLSRSDEGTYSCKAANIKGSFTASTVITVLASPNELPGTQPPYMAASVKPDKSDTDISIGTEECPHRCQCTAHYVDCAGDGTHPRDKLPDGIPTTAVSISFASNALHSLETNAFAKYGNLQELRLDDNHISTIDSGAFAMMDGLKTLTLKGNKLAKIQKGTFKYLTRLNVLVLDNNGLTYIQADTFEGLEKVNWLYIRNNLIHTISDDAFKPLKEIKFIHLEGNRLRVISLPTITTLTNMKYASINKIFVDDNKFDCSCHMEDLRSFVRSSEAATKHPNLFADGIVCSGPAEHTDARLEDISETLECVEDILVEVVPTKARVMAGIIVGVIFLIAFIVLAMYIATKKMREETMTVSAKSSGSSDVLSSCRGTSDVKWKVLEEDNFNCAIDAEKKGHSADNPGTKAIV